MAVFIKINKKENIHIVSTYRCRVDNVTLIPLVLQLGLRIGPIQRMGAN